MNYELIKFKDGEFELDVNVSPNEDTVWLTQQQIATLFEKSKSTISEHINNALLDGEIDKTDFGISELSVNKKKYTLYNLNVIISVGYRVHSNRGIMFRKWATKVLKEYMVNGFSVNVPYIEICEYIFLST